jgi:hypothetical protein
MKKFILTSMMVVMASVSLLAQSAVTTWLPNSNVVTNLIITGPITIKRVTVSGVGSTPQFLFYDYNTNGSLGLGTLQYSNTTSFSNIVNAGLRTNSVVFTNSLGLARTNQYVGVFHFWTNVVTATVSNSVEIGSYAVQSGVPYTVDVNWIVEKGLTVRLTNGFNPIIILEYQ